MEISRQLPPPSLSLAYPPVISGNVPAVSQDLIPWQSSASTELALLPDTYESTAGIERVEEYRLNVGSAVNPGGDGTSSGTRNSGAGFRSYPASNSARNNNVTPQNAFEMTFPVPENGEIVNVYA